MERLCKCGCGTQTKTVYSRGHNLNAQRPASERFWRFVTKSEGCWEWQGGTSTAGYGRITVDKVKTLAHRFSYQLHCGDIPEGLFVCHACDNRRCVNPSHFFLGTNDDNMKDMVKKGRHADEKGERNPNSKLTNDDVLEIIRLRSDGSSRAMVASRFGISTTMVTYITSGRYWKCVSSAG